MALFASAYALSCRGRDLRYTSTGSTVGRSEFISGKTDFGGSDSPLGIERGETERAKSRCGGQEAWNLPVVFGAIAIVYNLPGIDSLVLDAPTIAKIFNGRIGAWDAPEIKALNPMRALPAEPIAVISRTDESGTTDSFQSYLQAAAGAAWGLGAGGEFNGTVGQGASGNEGAWAAIRRAVGSITYVAWPFARKNGLTTARILTPASAEPVALSVDSVSRTMAGVTVRTKGNNLVLDLPSLYVPTHVGSYPIVMVTYEVTCSTYPDPATALAVKSFLSVAVNAGQADLAESGYVPIPNSVKERLVVAIDAIS